MKKMAMKWRIIVPIAAILLIGISLMAVVVAMRFAQVVTDTSKQALEAQGGRFGNSVKADLETSFGAVKSLSSIMANAAGTPAADRDAYISMMRQIQQENNKIFAIWSIFEPNTFDGKDSEYAGRQPDHDATGRFVPYLFDIDGTPGLEALTGYD